MASSKTTGTANASRTNGKALTRMDTTVGLQVAAAEANRLIQDKELEGIVDWKQWGPYLSERQWATVREDYSTDGRCWDYFPHDQARSRAYRWGEDGLLGICDKQCRLCFSVALWNEKDPILKERLFGLTGTEGNHGEDCKECYYYLDSTPTHSYMKALYKYPQEKYPYRKLVEENRRRKVHEPGQPEYELEDTGVFDNSEYWDVFAEYAKSTPNDILIRLKVANRGKKKAKVHLLPTLWYRNTWAFEEKKEAKKPVLMQKSANHVLGEHESLNDFHFYVDAHPTNKTLPAMLWTNNESSDKGHTHPYSKDAFHRYVIKGEREAINPEKKGTKMAAHYELEVEGGREVVVKLRLTNACFSDDSLNLFGREFDVIFSDRIREAKEFYDGLLHKNLSHQEARVSKQAYAGLLWSKQFYHYSVKKWLKDVERTSDQNSSEDWAHLAGNDIISMPDKWEYPWYASWDLAFHMIAFAKVDPEFAKDQLLLFLEEYMSPKSGRMPSSEMNLDAITPPMHAWAVYRVYKMTAPKEERDQEFLAQCFEKLQLHFDWWANHKDSQGRTVLYGSFLGLNDVGIFDQSKLIPNAEGIVWMVFFCVGMLEIALELASHDAAYEEVASKYFDHFITIKQAMQRAGGRDGNELWNEEDGFYYNHISVSGECAAMRVRSMFGLIPLYACLRIEHEVIEKLPNFTKKVTQLLQKKPELANQIMFLNAGESSHILALLPKERIVRILHYLLDEEEFFSPYGIRSLSKHHERNPVSLSVGGQTFDVSYAPGESRDWRFGVNVNWRGPVWLCLNFLITEALERYYFYYGDELKVECPTGSGNKMNLLQVSQELCHRIVNLFAPDKDGKRACHGDDHRYKSDPHWKDLVLFYEYFNGDNGKGCGASHKTGWTALVSRFIDKLSKNRPA